MTEGYIQVLPDSTGKRTRTELSSAVQPDGSTVDVHTQVVKLCDADRQLLEEMTVQLRRMSKILLILLQAVDDKSNITEADLDDVEG